VVIPCHNYARYLAACLQSIKASTLPPGRIIVVDDKSTDSPRTIADAYGAECVRVEYGDQSLTCQHGFNMVSSRYVLFFDADDVMNPGYIADAVARMEADRGIAFVYPWLDAFEQGSGPWHGTERAPDQVAGLDLEVRNWCPAGSVYRTHILHQALAVGQRQHGCMCNDWLTARGVLRSGQWRGVKTNIPIHYRIHRGQMSEVACGTYAQQASHDLEVVTIIIPFSGRWDAWPRLRAWLLSQDWPPQQTRLLILNSTHANLTANDLGLGDWSGASLCIERVDVGFAGLADIDRRNAPPAVTGAVEAAVAGLYNRAFQMVAGEWCLTIEDDVIPDRPDVIRRLFESVQPNTAGVSGLYRHRYHNSAVAFNWGPSGFVLLDLVGPEKETVVGTGFGCLLVRRSVMLATPLANDSHHKFFDVDVAVRLRDTGWLWHLDRGVNCDHMTQATHRPKGE
jgi:glycosyltransferase involved in cell wall biosynthesis